MIVIQARMGSTRLPGKVLRPLAGRSVLGWVIRAAFASQVPGGVVVATTDEPADDAVAADAASHGATVVRGDVDDVLSRFLYATSDAKPDAAVVRLTADCPLLDPSIIRGCWAAFEALDVDYLSTVTPRSLPRGLDVEVASVAALRQAGREAATTDRVHVTSYLYRRPGRFRVAGLTFSPAADDLRVTLDTSEDAAALDLLVQELGDRPPGFREVVEVLRRRPDIAALNADVRQKTVDEG